jgi:hypothetical protein
MCRFLLGHTCDKPLQFEENKRQIEANLSKKKKRQLNYVQGRCVKRHEDLLITHADLNVMKSQ